ncbi:MAG: tRNA-dihydrouridine synthase family protein [Muribaculaceae bacterium]|nr:tRNA-dihydrouridine synthase family protein [Muribaculaceae bacterium]
MGKEVQLMAAPLQGLTEAAWRNVHFRMFGDQQGDVEYFTPFIRVEKGYVRARDLRDFTSDLNQGINVTPQIIFRDVEEWKLLVDTLAEAGAERIDMNFGCPFIPQVKKGRGAGMLPRTDMVAQIADAMMPYAATLKFSVKMRLGVRDPSEAMELVSIINNMPLRHVTVHPRTALQQYKGELLLDEMAEFVSLLKHPVIYNGEISKPSDIENLSASYAGVMAGRGLLARPSLFSEFLSGRELSAHEQEDYFLSLMREMAGILEQRLCGPTQFRDKMKPYWEYPPASLYKKITKQGKKFGVIDSICWRG